MVKNQTLAALKAQEHEQKQLKYSGIGTSGTEMSWEQNDPVTTHNV